MFYRVYYKKEGALRAVSETALGQTTEDEICKILSNFSVFVVVSCDTCHLLADFFAPLMLGRLRDSGRVQICKVAGEIKAT